MKPFPGVAGSLQLTGEEEGEYIIQLQGITAYSLGAHSIPANQPASVCPSLIQAPLLGQSRGSFTVQEEFYGSKFQRQI